MNRHHDICMDIRREKVSHARVRQSETTQKTLWAQEGRSSREEGISRREGLVPYRAWPEYRFEGAGAF